MRLRISQLAGNAGVNLQTIRYYERRGLLAAPERSRSGYREYPADTVTRLRFIKQAQELGFSLAEIGELLDLRLGRATASACARVRSAAESKVNLVERKMAELQRMKRSLDRLVAACRARKPTEGCPILEGIETRAKEEVAADG